MSWDMQWAGTFILIHQGVSAHAHAIKMSGAVVDGGTWRREDGTVGVLEKSVVHVLVSSMSCDMGPVLSGYWRKVLS